MMKFGARNLHATEGWDQWRVARGGREAPKSFAMTIKDFIGSMCFLLMFFGTGSAATWAGWRLVTAKDGGAAALIVGVLAFLGGGVFLFYGLLLIGMAFR
jgi:hypothetical protein